MIVNQLPPLCPVIRTTKPFLGPIRSSAARRSPSTTLYSKRQQRRAGLSPLIRRRPFKSMPPPPLRLSQRRREISPAFSARCRHCDCSKFVIHARACAASPSVVIGDRSHRHRDVARGGHLTAKTRLRTWIRMRLHTITIRVYIAYMVCVCIHSFFSSRLRKSTQTHTQTHAPESIKCLSRDRAARALSHAGS